MADLSAIQAPSLEDLIAGVGDLSAPEAYVPPRSGTFRTSRFPGFWGSATGTAPSNTPNPLAGDNPVALPPSGVDPNAAAPAPTGLSSITSNPVGKNGGTSVDERQSNQEQVAKSAGMTTDPWDAAKTVGLGLSLTSPTGIAGLIGQTAANLAGVPNYIANPVAAALGDETGPFDIRSNISRRPGYSEAYDTALESAHNRGLRGPQASQSALDSAKAAGDIQASAQPFGVHRNQSATPAPQDVTAANRATGFGGQGANPAPKGPGDVLSGKPTVDLNGPGAVDAPGAGSAGPGGIQAGQATARPSGATPAPGASLAAAAANRGGGAGANGGGGGGYSSSSSRGDKTGSQGGMAAGRGGYEDGGTVVRNQKIDEKMVSKVIENHKVMTALARRTGMSVPALVEKSLKQDGELGRRARIHKAMMDVVDAHAQRKATGGVMMTEDPGSDPSTTMQYNPPPEMTEGEGDIVDAKLTPGEMVITKGAAVQYDPEVLRAINDPKQAAEINQMIEDFLGDQSDDTGDDDTDGSANTSDDQSGLGSLSSDFVRSRPASVAKEPSGISQPKSRLANITRVA